MKRILSITLLVCCTMVCGAQVVLDNDWQHYWEEWVEMSGQETIPDDLVETVEALRENPHNINDTHSTRLLELPFVSEFQWEILKASIRQSGPFYSVNELRLLNGFDDATLRLLRPLVYAGPAESEETPSLRQLLRQGRSHFVTGARRTMEPSRGYRDSIYMGSPYRTYFRYNYKCGDHLQFQLSGEKDAGEEFFKGSQPQGFDHYGGHLLLNDFGAVRRAVLGRYNLQFGQGLTLWTGFAPWGTADASQYRNAQGVKTAGAMTEYDGLLGAGATLRVWRQWDVTAFYSYNFLDATLPSDGRDDCVQGLYSSGLHRSINEMKKKDQLTEQLYGGALQWKGSHFTFGVVGYGSLYSKAIEPPQRRYNHFHFRGEQNIVGGVHAAWRYRGLLFFGEASASATPSELCAEASAPPLAGVVGMQLFINGGNQIGITYRNYSPTYWNNHSAAIGRNSGNHNEEGATMRLLSELPWDVKLDAAADFYRFPYVKYGVYGSSWGEDYRVQLSRNISRKMRVKLLYGSRSYLHNLPTDAYTEEMDAPDGHIYITEPLTRRWVQLRIEAQPSLCWHLATRVAGSWAGGEHRDNTWGMLLLQDVSFKPLGTTGPLTLTTRGAWFDITGYDARIYATEGDWVYEYSTLALNGRGLRVYGIVRYGIASHWSLSAKYAATLYTDRTSVGSGYDITESSHRQEIKVQLALEW